MRTYLALGSFALSVMLAGTAHADSGVQMLPPTLYGNLNPCVNTASSFPQLLAYNTTATVSTGAINCNGLAGLDPISGDLWLGSNAGGGGADNLTAPKLHMSGAQGFNTDDFYFQRRDISSNISVLVLNLGDDAQDTFASGHYGDAFVIGGTSYPGNTFLPRFTFTSNGRLGINTPAPAAQLDITATTDGNTGYTNGPAFHTYTGNIGNLSTPNIGGNVYIGGRNDMAFDGGTDSTFEFVNSGAATQPPINNYPQGATLFTWAGDANNYGHVNLSILNSGGVGIGTNIPLTALDIWPTQTNFDQAAGGLWINGSEPSGSTHKRLGLFVDNQSNGNWNALTQAGDSMLLFKTDGGVDDKNAGGFVIGPWSASTSGRGLRMDTSGNVGLGVSSPKGSLDIENGTNNATLCLNGGCVTSLNGGTVQTGANGANGANGSNGANGVGVASVKIDNNNHLQVTLTNNTVQDAGVLPSLPTCAANQIIGTDGNGQIACLPGVPPSPKGNPLYVKQATTIGASQWNNAMTNAFNICAQTAQAQGHDPEAVCRPYYNYCVFDTAGYDGSGGDVNTFLSKINSVTCQQLMCQGVNGIYASLAFLAGECAPGQTPANSGNPGCDAQGKPLVAYNCLNTY